MTYDDGIEPIGYPTAEHQPGPGPVNPPPPPDADVARSGPPQAAQTGSPLEALEALERIARLLSANGTKLERIAQALDRLDARYSTGQIAKAPSPSANGSAPQAAPADPGWTCPVHGTSKVIPAGISRKTNKPYAAFVVCGMGGCEERPPRG